MQTLNISEVKVQKHWSPDGYSEPAYTIIGHFDGESEDRLIVHWGSAEDLAADVEQGKIVVVDNDTNDRMSASDVREYYAA